MTKPAMIKIKNSSNIDQVGYRDGDLYVQFHDGAVYRHAGVPHDLFQAIQDTDSAGKFYHGRIKGKFVSEKMPAGFSDPAPIIDDAGKPHPVTAAEDAAAQEAKAKAEAELNEAIFNVVRDLNVEDDSHWTEAGEPDLNVVSDKLDQRVTREQVDAATGNLRRQPKNTFTVRLLDGPAVDAFSEEGQAMILKAVGEAVREGELPTISVNDGPYHTLGSPEADAALEAAGIQVPKLVIPAKTDTAA